MPIYRAHRRLIGPHTHQPKPGSQAGGWAIRRGEGGGCGGGCGIYCLYGRPPLGWDPVPPRWEPGNQDAGDHKGPPHRPSSTLAPTDGDGLLLRLMPMRADQSAVGAINRPLLYDRIILLKVIITTIVSRLELL